MTQCQEDINSLMPTTLDSLTLVSFIITIYYYYHHNNKFAIASTKLINILYMDWNINLTRDIFLPPARDRVTVSTTRKLFHDHRMLVRAGNPYELPSIRSRNPNWVMRTGVRTRGGKYDAKAFSIGRMTSHSNHGKPVIILH